MNLVGSYEAKTNCFSPYLRNDIPYTPHVTLGSYEAYEEAEKANFDIAGTFNEVALLKIDGSNQIQTIQTISLPPLQK